MGCLRLHTNYTTDLTLVYVNKNLSSLKTKNLALSTSIYGFNGQEKDDEIKGDGNSYDFGDRMYDPRIAKWLTKDRLEKKYPSISPYAYCINNPIKFIDVEGQFIVDPTIKEMYPKVALILENAYNLYHNLPLPKEVEEALQGTDYKTIFNDVFKDALLEFSTLTPEQINEALKNGQGPRIKMDELDKYNADTKELTLVNGMVITNKDGTSEDAVFGSGDQKGILRINEELIQIMEFELDPSNTNPNLEGFGGKSTDPLDKKNQFLALISTVFHEMVHNGRNQTGAVKRENGREMGKEFEYKAFGGDLTSIRKKDLNTKKNILTPSPKINQKSKAIKD